MLADRSPARILLAAPACGLASPRFRILASLRSKLLALSLVAMAPGFFAMAWTQTEIARLRQAEFRDQAAAAALTASSEVERLASGVQAVLTTLFHAPVVRRMEPSSCNAFLAALKPDLPHIANIRVFDATGAYRCGSQPEAEMPDLDSALFQSALWRPGPQMGGYIVDPASRRPALPVAMAMRDAGAPAFGVIVAALDIDWLGKALERRGIPPGGSVTIADAEGVIVFRQPAPDLFVGKGIPAPYRPLLKAGTPGVEDILGQDGTRRILGYVPIGASSHGLYVSAGLSWRASEDSVAKARWTGAMLALGAAIATLGATWLAGDCLFVSPLRRVTTVLRHWRGGDAAARTRFSAATGEIGQLGAELDRMMDQIARADSERNLLSSELLHRVKNTLATVNAIASATMSRSEPARDLLPAFMSRIAALARTHDILTARQWRDASVTALLKAELDPVTPDNPGRVALTGPPVLLPAREALGLIMIVHELCTNALKYGALSSPQGHVDIRWSLRAEAPPALLLEWRERGGPAVAAPARAQRGFGTKLIGRALGDAGAAVLSYEPEGVVCSIEIALPAAAGVEAAIA